VRPDDPDQVLDDLGEVIVEFLAQQGGLKGNASSRRSTSGSATGPAQHRRQGGYVFGEVRTEFLS